MKSKAIQLGAGMSQGDMRGQRRRFTWVIPYAAAAAFAVFVPPVAAETKTTRFLQADNPSQVTLSKGLFAKNYGGYTGAGFANGADNRTAFLQWNNVRVQASGSKKLTFRYANGTGSVRSVEIQVNDVVVATSQAFPATGAWTTWQTVEVLGAEFVEGSNTIRIRSTTSSGLPNIDRVDVSEIDEPVPDWGIAVVESQMLRQPDAATTGWSYTHALFMHGIYLTYRRTQDPRYLAYVKRWVDEMIGSQGNIYTARSKSTVRSLNEVDYWFPGTVVLDMYNHHPNDNYRIALQTIRNRYSESTNTSGGLPNWTSRYWNGGGTNPDGGYQHRSGTPNQLWLDGTFMTTEYLGAYGDYFLGADKTFADDTNAVQLLAAFKHLKDGEFCQVDSDCGTAGACVKLGLDDWGRCSVDDSGKSGLLFHAYDGDGNTASHFASAGENDSNYGSGYAAAVRTQEFWGRALGWFAVAAVDVLETLDPSHPERADLIAVLQGLADALKNYQDGSGRWFQLVNKPDHPDNWTETSCSAMFSYMMKKGRDLGFITNDAIDAAAVNGYEGVLANISWVLDDARAAHVTDLIGTSEITGPGDEAHYLGRLQVTNDKHGLGAFLMMYEHFNASWWVQPLPGQQ